jgi:hypothetical protein
MKGNSIIFEREGKQCKLTVQVQRERPQLKDSRQLWATPSSKRTERVAVMKAEKRRHCNSRR